MKWYFYPIAALALYLAWSRFNRLPPDTTFGKQGAMPPGLWRRTRGPATNPRAPLTLVPDAADMRLPSVPSEASTAFTRGGSI